MSEFKAGEFEDDGNDGYELLYDAALLARDVQGITCEIGLRAGGGTRRILDALQTQIAQRTHIAIDPYGNIPYYWKEGIIPEDTDYTNNMRDRIMITMSQYCIDNPNVNFYLYTMEDTEFFKRFSDGIPVYFDRGKQILNQYSLVHFDGPHDLESTFNETLFFAARTTKGSVFVYDDVNDYYNHNIIRSYLLHSGWLPIGATYRKTAFVRPF
jgi:hypothetical protein